MSSTSGMAAPPGRPAVGSASPHWAAVVRLELAINDAHRIHLELLSDPTLDLELSRGDVVYVSPRLINVFDPQNHTFRPVVPGR